LKRRIPSKASPAGSWSCEEIALGGAALRAGQKIAAGDCSLPPKGIGRPGKRGHLLRRAWNRPVGAEYATVTREWLEALATA
jgi:hypothetical protein